MLLRLCNPASASRQNKRMQSDVLPLDIIIPSRSSAATLMVNPNAFGIGTSLRLSLGFTRRPLIGGAARRKSTTRRLGWGRWSVFGVGAPRGAATIHIYLFGRREFLRPADAGRRM